jgi:hypothetical protein
MERRVEAKSKHLGDKNRYLDLKYRRLVFNSAAY